MQYQEVAGGICAPKGFAAAGVHCGIRANHSEKYDLALIKAERGDRWGNLTYRQAARNFGPVMAMAAKFTVASVHEVLELGQLDPEAIVTPGIFVHRIVRVPRLATQAGGFKSAS